MKILFICKHNRFRSKIAEALFNYYNENKEHKTKGAGVKLDLLKPYVSDNTKYALSKKGVKVSDKPTQLNKSLIDWADKIVVVADDVDVNLFPPKKLEVWPIHDCDQSDLECITDRVDVIEKKILSLVKKLA